MKSIIKNLITSIRKRYEGYPIVVPTAPRQSRMFRVDRNDPNFDKPLSRLNIDYNGR